MSVLSTSTQHNHLRIRGRTSALNTRIPCRLELNERAYRRLLGSFIELLISLLGATYGSGVSLCSACACGGRLRWHICS